MKVSVIVSVYKTEKYLRKCLDSIVAQTLDDIETVVVNDGSPDNSEEILKSYAQKYSNIKYVTTENHGLSMARNLGLSMAEGDMVIFADSDDWLHPQMLEKMYNRMVETESDAAFCNIAYVWDDKVINDAFIMPDEEYVNMNINTFKLETFRAHINVGTCVHNKMYRRDVILGSGILFENENIVYAEDACFYYKIISKINRLCVVDETLYYYYQREDSIMHRYKPNLAYRIEKLVCSVDRFYKRDKNYIDIHESMRMLTSNFMIELFSNEIKGNVTYEEFIKNVDSDFIRENSRICKSEMSYRRQMIIWLYKKEYYFPLFILVKLYFKFLKHGEL